MRNLIIVTSFAFILVIADYSQVMARQDVEANIPAWFENPRESNRDTLFSVGFGKSTQMRIARIKGDEAARFNMLIKLNQVITELNKAEIKGINTPIREMGTISWVSVIQSDLQKDQDSVLIWYSQAMLKTENALASINEYLKEELDESEYAAYEQSGFSEKILDILISPAD